MSVVEYLTGPAGAIIAVVAAIIAGAGAVIAWKNGEAAHRSACEAKRSADAAEEQIALARQAEERAERESEERRLNAEIAVIEEMNTAVGKYQNKILELEGVPAEMIATPEAGYRWSLDWVSGALEIGRLFGNKMGALGEDDDDVAQAGLKLMDTMGDYPTVEQVRATTDKRALLTAYRERVDAAVRVFRRANADVMQRRRDQINRGLTTPE